MTAKIVGAALLLLAGGMMCLRWITARRKEQQCLLSLAGALGRMEGAVRWQQLPFPRLLAQESDRRISGVYMKGVLQLLKSGSDLQKAWQQTFCEFKPAEAAEILCRTELSGDAQQITGALCMAAQQLRQLAAQLAQRRGEQERVCVAVGMSLTGLLVVLLI